MDSKMNEIPVQNSSPSKERDNKPLSSSQLQQHGSFVTKSPRSAMKIETQTNAKEDKEIAGNITKNIYKCQLFCFRIRSYSPHDRLID
jgi:hypothetical protein